MTTRKAKARAKAKAKARAKAKATTKETATATMRAWVVAKQKQRRWVRRCFFWFWWRV